MVLVTKSIGTCGRDYSTQVLWEGDLDNAGVYSSGDDARGERYNDSAFDEALTVNGGGTVGLASRTLTVATSQRHNGTAGTGARLVATASRPIAFATVATTEEFFEYNYNGNGTTNNINGNAGANTTTIRQDLIHDISSTTTTVRGVVASRALTLHNVIVYDIKGTAAANTSTIGINLAGNAGDACRPQNVTIDRVAVTNAGATGNAVGVNEATGVSTVQNVISTTPTVAGSGAASCFNGTFDTISHCLSSDATASGTGSLTNKSADNQFVSTVDGSEDYHLKTGADAIAAGTDLAASPTGVNLDIDNFDRDSSGVVWDMGADQMTTARFYWGRRRRTINALIAG